MGPEREDKLTEVFSTASRLEGDERTAYLDSTCGSDEELRNEVESLLAYDARSDELISATFMGSHIHSLLDDLSVSAESHQPVRIGSYRILDVLGHGGQGIVYKAEQSTPRRTVALKVLRAGPLATHDDLRRFHKEIQALALLRHPAIATIFDGDHTSDGDHYFTMEFVDGVPINSYVRDRSLSLSERLELFCAVCDGVQYAHQKGVIHRDLKPTNILVDSDGAPKIIDFGLVRMEGTEISAVSMASTAGSIVGSFQYMSPEQTRSTREEVTAQTDVYSLGIILYELLTGSRPYELGSSLPEAVLTICETQPLPPSTIDRNLRGDLDTILMTALEKEPSSRYETVAQFADDIRRFLRGDAVLAKPPRLVATLGKKLQRHRTGALLLLAVLVAGIAWFSIENRSRHRLVAGARETAVDVQYFLEKGDRGESLARAHRLFNRHHALPEARLVVVQARFRAGEKYEPIYLLRGGMSAEHGVWAFRLLLSRVIRESDPEAASELERRALREFPDTADAWHLRSFTTFDPGEALRCTRAALEREPHHVLARMRLAYLCERVGDFACAKAAAREVINSNPSEKKRFFWRRFEALMLMKEGDYRGAVDLYDSLLDGNPTHLRVYSDRALAYLCLEDYEQAVSDYSAMMSPDTELTSWAHWWRATPLWILGRREEASRDYEAFRKIESIASYADARLYLLRQERSRLLGNQGRPAEAARLAEVARVDLDVARESTGKGSWLRKILDCVAGEVSPEELIQLADRSNPEQVCEAYYYAAEVCLLGGRTEDARRWYRDCLATGLHFDVEVLADPISEYYLARWRVEQLEENSAAGK